MLATSCHLHAGIDNWHVTRTEENYVEYFKEQKDKVVYLTADSSCELETLDPESIYVIGGMVDHNMYVGGCILGHDWP